MVHANWPWYPPIVDTPSLAAPGEPHIWRATVIARYDFESGRIGESCEVIAQTAFDAWRKAEPRLGVAREHIALEMLGPALITPKAPAAPSPPKRHHKNKKRKASR
jgi:hypothetical protein